MSQQDICIEIKNLSKTFQLRERGISATKKLVNFFRGKSQGKPLKALDGINLEVKKGEFWGIIGKNGSGKSTLLKILLGAIEPDEGSVIKTEGKILRLALGMGFDPQLSARDNIYLNGTILGLDFRTIGNKFEEIIAFAEIEKFVDTPLKFYSSGMKSKLSFAIAMHADAEIILIDEFFGDVGDEAFKAKSQKAFENNIMKGKTVLHVSHSLDLIQDHCDKVMILDHGRATHYEDPSAAIAAYKLSTKSTQTGA